MRIKLGSLAAVAFTAVMLSACSEGASTAQASGGEDQGEKVSAVGCPMTPSAGCLTLVSAGKTYDVSDAGIDMTRGVGVSVRGRAAGEVTACGAKLSEVKVDYLGLACGAPAAPAAPAE